MRIEDFDYPLPDERIARYPLADRSGARLLTYTHGRITDRRFAELPELLPPGSLVVGNSTRVIHARLMFPLATGRSVEIFCLEPLEPTEYARSLSATDRSVTWKCLIGGNRRWKEGPLALTVTRGDRPTRLVARRGDRIDNTFAVTFSWEADPTLSFGEVLEAAGNIPLPPYLRRQAEGEDRHRYQTVFARRDGSVAAPTAGLHFTPDLMERLASAGVDFQTVTLHVGAGTFKPVTTPTLSDHTMHREYFTVDLTLLRRLEEQLRAGRPVVSVGTTSLRCLESLYYIGARGRVTGDFSAEVGQWVATESEITEVAPLPALAALIAHLEQNERGSLSGYTQLMLTPAARIRLADGLITNFHQPRSTLLLLIGAFVGEDWRGLYDHALASGYRFLSYGDSSLLWRRSAGA